MNSLVNKIAIMITVLLYNTAQAPGIADRQVHAEFVFSHGDLSTWSSLIRHDLPISNHA